MNSKTELRALAGSTSSKEVAVVFKIFSRQTDLLDALGTLRHLQALYPRFKLYSDINSVPNKVAGTVTRRIDSKVISC